MFAMKKGHMVTRYGKRGTLFQVANHAVWQDGHKQ